jgi:hypothetical protein
VIRWLPPIDPPRRPGRMALVVIRSSLPSITSKASRLGPLVQHDGVRGGLRIVRYISSVFNIPMDADNRARV